MLFAAAHPERVVGLVLQGAEVRERRDEDWPWGEADEAEFEQYMARVPETLGQGLGFGYVFPSVGDVEWGRAADSSARLRARATAPRMRPCAKTRHDTGS